MSNFSTFDVKPYTLNQKIGEKIWMLAGTGLGAGSYTSGKIIKSGLTYLQADYPELFNIVGHGETTSNFTARTIATTVHVLALTYGNGVYLLGGQGGVLRTSTDAITWTAQTTGTTSSILALTYGNNTYVMAGNGGMLATSTDAVTWTARTSGTTSTINALTYGNDTYVYAGIGGVLRTSTDAITWTARTSGTTSTIESLTYGNGLYVYGAWVGVLATSTDAVTWTAITSGTTSTIFALIYSNGIYVYSGQNGALATSTDAFTWTTRTSGTTQTINTLAYGNGIYLLGGNSATFRTSTDGITWTAKTSLNSANIQALSYYNGVYILAGDLGLFATSTDLYYSVNASTYTYNTQFKVNSFTTTTIAFSTTVNNTASIIGYVVAKSSSNFSGDQTYPLGHLLINYSQSSAPTGYIQTGAVYSQTSYPALYSQLGLINTTPWTPRTTGISTGDISALTYGNGIYVLAGTGGMLRTSTDAVTWTARTSGTTDLIYDLVYNSGLYVRVGSAAYNARIGTSTDAITWTVRSSGVGGNLNNIIWDGSKYVANGNSLVSSSDGTTWTTHYPGDYGSGGDGGMEGMAYSSSLNRLVAAGYHGWIITSDDGGATWVRRTGAYNTAILSIGWFSNVNLFITVQGGGIIQTSPDGITWTQRTSGTTNDLNGIIWNGTYFVVSVMSVSGAQVRSTDGITWTYVTGLSYTLGSSTWAGLAASSAVTVLCDSVGRVWTSPSNDLTTWTDRGQTVAGTVSGAITYSPELNMFAIAGNAAIITSSDGGVNWTVRRSTDLGYTHNKMVWTGSYFFISCNVRYIKSTDGITWTNTTAHNMFNPTALAFVGNNTIVMASRSYSGEVITRSTDNGSSWKASMICGGVSRVIKNVNDYIILTSSGIWKASSALGLDGLKVDSSSNYNEGIFAAGQYVVVGNTGLLKTSTDGTTWTTRSMGFSNSIYGIAYGSNKYVSVGSGGVFSTSTDGITWTRGYSGTDSNIFTLMYENNLFVYGSSNGLLATSTDATTGVYNSNIYNLATEFLVPEITLGTSNTHKVWIKT